MKTIIVISLIAVLMIPVALQESFQSPMIPNEMNVFGADFEVYYVIVNAELLNVRSDDNSLVATINAPYDGSLYLTIPIEYDILSVLIDGEKVDFDITTSSTHRAFDITFQVGSEKIVFVAAQTIQSQCNNPKHVLVERSNDRVACVYESTAEKLGWEIVLPVDTVSSKVNHWMPNPDEDIEKFGKKFAAAAGVTLSDPYVSLSINHLGANMRLAQSDIDATKSEKFVRDFMDYMGFEFEEKDFYERPNFGSREFPNDAERYLISQENISFIAFEFYHYEEEWYEGKYYDASTDVRITFTGWTNYPELIVFTLSEDKALQYAKEFSNDLKRNLNLLDGYDEDEEYGCELLKEANPKYPLKIIVNKKVIKGVPYYVSEVGLCVSTYNNEDNLGLGMFSRLMLHQDAVNGTDIFMVYGPSGE